MGYFANTLVLRTHMDDDPTFRQLLARVRETALGAYDRQDTPFEQLVTELQPARDLSYTPLFQALFVLDDSRAPSGPWAGSASNSTTSRTRWRTRT